MPFYSQRFQRKYIDTPTAAQEMIYGKTRRRIPILWDVDNPVLSGPVQNQDAYMQSVAAQRPFFFDHIQELAKQAFAEFAELTGDMREGFLRGFRMLLEDNSRLAAVSAQRRGGVAAVTLFSEVVVDLATVDQVAAAARTDANTGDRTLAPAPHTCPGGQCQGVQVRVRPYILRRYLAAFTYLDAQERKRLQEE